MIEKVAVLGLGKVGSLVSYLLSKSYDVVGIDRAKPWMAFDTITYKQLDVSNVEDLQNVLKKVNAVISCLTYHLNKKVADIAIAQGIHYFDLTEDISTTNHIRLLAKDATSIVIPQCGLAPGFISIAGYNLIRQFSKLRDIELRVGALPRYPNGQLGYSFTWSPSGVINEYINDAEVIHNSTRKMVPSLQAIEHIQIEGQEFEAFTTSGGLGTLCETLEGKVDTLNYKTIRYPGHAKLMRFLLYELLLKKKRTQIEDILTEAKPPVSQDIVYVYAVVEGYQNNKLVRKEFYRAYTPKNIDGIIWRAISWTTAASIVAVVELVRNGKLPTRGVVKQEDIAFDDLLATSTGLFFK